MKRVLTLLGFVIGVVGIGFVMGLTNMPGAWYQGLEKPAFTPPNWLFAPAWTTLYVLIAVAGWRVWTRFGMGMLFAIWLLQMGLNFLWSPVVFGIHNLALGLAVIIGTLVCILLFIGKSCSADRIAALCFVPYAAWVAFATYLNAGLLVLN
ncbi:MAG: tryptophan-rich sensory protein [Rhodobacteraceae bacterium]|nr:tryptophan-rich sensory protein [Paracoccaceae bacterium]